MMTVKRKNVFVLSGAAALVAAGLGTAAVYDRATDHVESSGSQLALTYEADFSDDANLAGGADDLFYGKVTVVKGQKDLGIGLETQYAVEVQRVFKGTVSGVIVVNQQGGRDADGNVVDIPEDDTLLQAGSRYLFATKYNPDRKFHTVIPVHGDQPIPNGEAPAPGIPDANGDGQATMSDRWVAAVQNQNDLSTAPPAPDVTEEPDEDPTPEPSPTAP
ncbi:hypothetical protein PV390_23535 [Streptomyces sp. ME02-6991-2A]|uniref:hypothetical protein n=1 Tax=Streptomyces TaxID=1883 RepID=UPI001008665A|nr:hypothetical protein [Streptomyces sp. ME02-6991-2A]MDX3377374.1 hypothetical protein [Streptomyces sp. ME02-6991-2A]